MPLEQDAFSYPPRGLNRVEAARYIGVSPTTFDEMIADGRMPRAKRMSKGRVTWDRYALDAAYSDLPEKGAINLIDAAMNSGA